MAMSPKHFLDIDAFERPTLRQILDKALAMKAGSNRNGPDHDVLSGRTLAMIFDRPSTRTRVSFEVAMHQLGGDTIVLNSSDMQLERGETIADTGRVLSRYVDAIMLRTGPHENLTELAENASVPVINGLTERSHPCQVMADIMTFEEHRGSIEGSTVAWIGDVNNVAVSWMQAAPRLGFWLNIAFPEALAPEAAIMDQVKSEGGNVKVFQDPAEAVAGADSVVTDVWVSMGHADAERRQKLLEPYQVNADLMARAADDAIFMHCLPAHRGREVTGEVIDGPQSVVFDEAENRLHIQKAILVWCIGTG
jgi:ornithine carbamoyltransferase